MLELLYILLLLLMQQQADTTQVMANIQQVQSEASASIIKNVSN